MGISVQNSPSSVAESKNVLNFTPQRSTNRSNLTLKHGEFDSPQFGTIESSNEGGGSVDTLEKKKELTQMNPFEVGDDQMKTPPRLGTMVVVSPDTLKGGKKEEVIPEKFVYSKEYSDQVRMKAQNLRSRSDRSPPPGGVKTSLRLNKVKLENDLTKKKSKKIEAKEVQK